MRPVDVCVRRVLPVILVVSTSVLYKADESEQKGAKALFFEAENGQVTASANSTAPSPKGKQTAPTGLRYFIELRQDTGSVRRVSPTRVFHSGERIRIYLAANVPGRIVIYQAQDSGTESRLFPVEDGTDAAVVPKGRDVVLPSSHAWFRFDDHPGQIRLTILLLPSSAAEKGDEEQSPSRPVSSLPSVADAQQAVQAVKGSKALVVEEDSGEEKARYEVLDDTRGPDRSLRMLATEVMLFHER